MVWKLVIGGLLTLAQQPALAFDPVACESSARHLRKAARELEDAASSFAAARPDDRGEAMRSIGLQADEVERLTAKMARSCAPRPPRL